MKLSDKGIIVRKTIEEDLPLIYSAGISEPSFQFLLFEFNAGNLADIFASDKSILYSAVRKKKVLGFITGSVNGTESRIHWIMVKENFRKAGIGKELLRRFIDESKIAGAENYSLNAVSGNSTESIKFFTGNGFIVNENFIELKFKTC